MVSASGQGNGERDEEDEKEKRPFVLHKIHGTQIFLMKLIFLIFYQVNQENLRSIFASPSQQRQINHRANQRL